MFSQHQNGKMFLTKISNFHTIVHPENALSLKTRVQSMSRWFYGLFTSRNGLITWITLIVVKKKFKKYFYCFGDFKRHTLTQLQFEI